MTISLFRIWLFMLISIMMTLGCRDVQPIDNTLEDCTEIPGLDRMLLPGHVLLLGELHGTIEGPSYVERIACRAIDKVRDVTIGLELPSRDQEAINAFLQSDGMDEDVKSVLSLSFWSKGYQDGRTSQAMLGLIETIRRMKANGQNVDILLVDEPGNSDRNAYMAQQLIQYVHQNSRRFVVVLTGNYHNMIHDGSGQMGEYVLDALGRSRVTSLNMSHQGGSAWLDIADEGQGVANIGGNGRSEIGVFIDERMGDYHGTLEVVRVHASRPAKELLD